MFWGLSAWFEKDCRNGGGEDGGKMWLNVWRTDVEDFFFYVFFVCRHDFVMEAGSVNICAEVGDVLISLALWSVFVDNCHELW